MTPSFCFVVDDGALLPARVSPQYCPWSKFDFNNTIKIKFIWDGECPVEYRIEAAVVTLRSRSACPPETDVPAFFRGSAHEPRRKRMMPEKSTAPPPSSMNCW